MLRLRWLSVICPEAKEVIVVESCAFSNERTAEISISTRDEHDVVCTGPDPDAKICTPTTTMFHVVQEDRALRNLEEQYVRLTAHDEKEQEGV